MTVIHIYTKASLTLLHIHMYNDYTNITVYICFVYTSLSILHRSKLQKNVIRELSVFISKDRETDRQRPTLLTSNRTPPTHHRQTQVSVLCTPHCSRRFGSSQTSRSFIKLSWKLIISDISLMGGPSFDVTEMI